MNLLRSGRKASRSKKDPEGRMPFMEHIRELRSRILKSVLAIVIATIVAFFYAKEIGDFLFSPLCKVEVLAKASAGQDQTKAACGNDGVLYVSNVLGPFAFLLQIALTTGVVAATPVWLYQIWSFVSPGLHRHERRYAVAFVSLGTPLFLAGAYFGYWILPMGLQALLGFTIDLAQNMILAGDFLDFVLRMLLVFGISFELPLFLVMLNLMGVLSAERMLRPWRWAVLGIFVFAAVATPTGDPITMSLMALPMTVLYFLAVGFSLLSDRRRSRNDPDAELDPDTASRIDTTPSQLDDVP